jgi:hypothetical protein
MDPYLARQCQIERLRETYIPILQGKFAINILLCRFPQLSAAVYIRDYFRELFY